MKPVSQSNVITLPGRPFGPWDSIPFRDHWTVGRGGNIKPAFPPPRTPPLIPRYLAKIDALDHQRMEPGGNKPVRGQGNGSPQSATMRERRRLPDEIARIGLEGIVSKNSMHLVVRVRRRPGSRSRIQKLQQPLALADGASWPLGPFSFMPAGVVY
jgi:hypothetical protein